MITRLFFLYWLVSLLCSPTKAQSYFPIPAVPNPEQFVKNIAYTAHLLTASTPRQPHEVRILIYGQSISAQEWWLQVKSFLEKKYPAAQLNMINKSIGGFSSDRLKLTVENDVVSFYPDLILFHDYGGEPDYETIIQTIRRRTTAEIIIQTDHIAVGQSEEWHGRHNQVWLPELCRKYNLALADVRTVWKTYLDQHNLQAKDLLTDAVHLNAHGNYLMAGILNKYFEALPATITPVQMPVKILKAGLNFKTSQKSLQLPVTGNRVDLVFAPGANKASPLIVQLDGKKLSTSLDCYYYTRPTALAPEKFFLDRIGLLLQMELGGNPQAEDWTLTVTGVDSVQQQIQFTLRGSRTGPDGSGSSATNFVSNSGRIKIPANSWFRRRNPGDFSQFRWLKPGNTLNWQVKSGCQDEVKPETGKVTVVQGVTNTSHQLKLTGKSIPALQEIRVYQPSLKD